MRLDIRYRMSFEYDAPVWESQNELRVRPRSDDNQQVIARRLVTAPASRVLPFVDYWGTTVHHVGVREPHLAFEIVAEAAVETQVPAPLVSDPAVESLVVPEFSMAHAEFLAPSSHTTWTPAVRELAVESTRSSTSVREQVAATVETVRNSLTYQPETTEIGVELHSLIEGGAGVCQDFAHLTIGLLRSIGVPARYVSGFLFAQDETDLEAVSDVPVSVQTHAWVEVAIPGHGWHAIDPTNNVDVVDRHVVIGHGRDYDDVAPVRGVFVGDATPTLESEVVIERMASAPRSSLSDGPRRLRETELRKHQQQAQQ